MDPLNSFIKRETSDSPSPPPYIPSNDGHPMVSVTPDGVPPPPQYTPPISRVPSHTLPAIRFGNDYDPNIPTKSSSFSLASIFHDIGESEPSAPPPPSELYPSSHISYIPSDTSRSVSIPVIPPPKSRSPALSGLGGLISIPPASEVNTSRQPFLKSSNSDTQSPKQPRSPSGGIMKLRPVSSDPTGGVTEMSGLNKRTRFQSGIEGSMMNTFPRRVSEETSYDDDEEEIGITRNRQTTVERKREEWNKELELEEREEEHRIKLQEQEDEEDIKDAKKWKNRLCVRVSICALAVLLIWMTSLQLCATLPPYFVLLPPLDEVVADWEKVVEVAFESREDHVDCAAREVAHCFYNLSVSSVILKERVNATLVANELKLSQAKNLTRNCQTQYLNIFENLNKYYTASVLNVLYIHENTTCTIPQQNQTNTLIQPGGSGQAAFLSFHQSQSYSDDEESAWLSVSSEVAARQAYDAEYVANKTNFLDLVQLQLFDMPDVALPQISAALDYDAFLNMSLDCMSLTMNNCSLGFTGLKDRLLKLEEDMKRNYEASRDRANQIYIKGEEYADDVQETMIPIKNFLGLATEYSAYMPFDAPIPGTYIDPLDVGDFDIPTYGNLDVPSIDELTLLYLDNITLFYSTLAEARRKVMEATNALKMNMSLAIGDFPHLFNDYNPPPVDVNMSDFYTRQDSFLSQQAITTVGIKPPDTNLNFSIDISKLSNMTGSFSFSTLKSFEMKTLSYPSYISGLLVILDNIAMFTFLFDYIWRGLRTVRTILRFWTASSLFLPTIDVRQYSTGNSSERPPWYYYASKAMTHENVFKVFFAALIALFTYWILSLYLGFYHEHIDGCVNGDANVGTTVTTNAFSIAYNWASSAGNANLTGGLSEFDTLRGEMCGTDNAQTLASMDAAMQNWIMYRDAQVSVAEYLTLLSTCIDTNDPSSSFDETAWNLATQSAPYPDIAATTALLDCPANGVDVYQPVMDSFTCSELPPCLAMEYCTGPDEDTLKLATWEAGCTTEWWIHSKVLRLMLSILIFVCMNVSAWVFVLALCRAFWRQLAPQGFTFLGTCTRWGRVKIATISRLENEIAKAVTRYEVMAIVMMIGALLLHLPWILALVYASRPLGAQNSVGA